MFTTCNTLEALPQGDIVDGVNGSVEFVEDDQTESIVQGFVDFKLSQTGRRLLTDRKQHVDKSTETLVDRLVDISDDLEERYGAQLRRDAEVWIESATFERFVQIAKGVFSDGQISWSRIVVLFMFAAKVVCVALARNLGGLVGDVIKFVVKFIFLRGIHRWIQGRGGWVAVLHDYGSGTTTNGLLTFTGLLLLALLALKVSNWK